MKSVYHGSESVSFLGPKIWEMLPDDYKDVDNLKIILRTRSLKIVLLKFTLIIYVLFENKRETWNIH